MNPWILRVAVLVAVVAAFFLGRAGTNPREPNHAHGEAVSAAPTTWTCAMHPQVQLPEAGPCPICGMDLIPLTQETAGDLGPTSLRLSERARRLASIQTSPVARGSAQVLRRLTGKLEADETRRRDVTAWVDGRVDRLYVDFTGVQIRQGDRLFDLYSPELYADQEALLQALSAARRGEERGGDELARKTLEAARERLRLAGLTSRQITAIEDRGAPSQHITIRSPLSGVVLHKAVEVGSWIQTGQHVYAIADLSTLWLQLEAFEDDLPWIRPEQRVAFENNAHPGRTFAGTVGFVDPVIDPSTHTARVRVEVPNPGGELKPGMLVRAQLLSRAEAGANALLIPASAPLITGTRAIVYVSDPQEEGVFTGREIVLGPRSGDFYVVASGLQEGERVVTHGAFKIDSALQIQARPSMMNPRGDLPARHDRHSSAAAASSSGSAQITADSKGAAALDDAVQLYFELSTALARDDPVAASTWAQRLSTAFVDAVKENDSAPWKEAAGRLAEAAGGVAQSTDLVGVRRNFETLSADLIGMIRRFGTSGGSSIVVYHCPMAANDTGADWLQAGGETENPYFGSAMHRCGAASEVLVATDDEAGGHAH